MIRHICSEGTLDALLEMRCWESSLGFPQLPRLKASTSQQPRQDYGETAGPDGKGEQFALLEESKDAMTFVLSTFLALLYIMLSNIKMIIAEKVSYWAVN